MREPWPRSDICDQAGAYYGIDLLAHRRRINGTKRDWPASSNGRLELFGRDRTQAHDPTHPTIFTQPHRKAQVTPPPAGSPPVIDQVSGLHAPAPERGQSVVVSVHLDGVQKTAGAVQNAPGDPARIPPAAC